MPEISYNALRELQLEQLADKECRETTSSKIDEHLIRKCREETLKRYHKQKNTPWSRLKEEYGK